MAVMERSLRIEYPGNGVADAWRRQRLPAPPAHPLPAPQARSLNLKPPHETSCQEFPADPLFPAEQVSDSNVRPEEWRKVRLRMPNEDVSGDSFEIEVLRPVSWIARTRCFEGGKINLDLPEMGVKATAEVLRVEPCCEIKDGLGRVVLGTFTHTHADTYRLTLGDGSQIVATGGHPFYSASYDTWVESRNLHVGEHLRTETGEAAILKIDHEFRIRRVYNIEVEDDHRYYVSTTHILVHNTSPKLFPNIGGEYEPPVFVSTETIASEVGIKKYDYIVNRNGQLIIGKSHAGMADGDPAVVENAFNNAGFDATGKYSGWYKRKIR